MDDGLTADAFGRALRDHHRGERTDPLWQCDGPERRKHPIEEFYFGEYDPTSPRGEWTASRLDGPLVDLGAGAGRDALYFQERFETVALESSPALVEAMRERGVDDARQGDMFALRDAFERDRFRSALVNGTQVGLAGSMRGLTAFLNDLAYVTTRDATAVIDGYDPDHEATRDLLGYRHDPTPGLADRVMAFEYGSDRDPILRVRLFSPDRVREAAVGTDWRVSAIRRGSDDDSPYYRAALATGAPENP